MSNSKLISCTIISPNKNSPRNHKIDTITIHCVVGQCSAERIGAIFKPTSRQASSNYGIGYDGQIGLYVDEADRSWCSSSRENDNRAITIEVASDTTHPYAVTEKAYAALLDLVEDICRRNGIKRLVWSTNKEDRVNHKNGCNMTVHRDYANKACPGEYLYSRHGEIAAEVNRRLGAAAAEPEGNGQGDGNASDVQGNETGACAVGNTVEFVGSTHYASTNASSGKPCKAGKAQITKICENGKHPYHLVKVPGGGSTVYGWVDAKDISGISGETAAQEITVGSKVRVKQGAKTYTGGGLASFVYTRDHIVKEISGDRVVITYGGVVVAAVKLADLTLVEA